MSINNKADKFLYDDIRDTLHYGTIDKNPRPRYEDGQPAHTISRNHVFRQYDLREEFPITTLRPIAWKTAIKEILWIYQDQSSDVNLLKEKYGVNIWDDWVLENDTIGVRYGETVKKYDLMNKLLNGLTNDPCGRRHIIDLYQYQDFSESEGLIPCAFCTIWNVSIDKDTEEKYLDLLLIQRSGDMLVASGAGGFNEVQYAALLMMVARHCGCTPRFFSHVIANEQIYDRHTQNAKEMEKRYTTNEKSKCPIMTLNSKKTNFYDFTIDDFELTGYDPIKPQLIFPIGI